MSNNQTYFSYTKDGIYVGKYFRNMKSLTFEATRCCYLRDVAAAVVQLAENYQLPVQMRLGKKTITVPFKNMKTFSVQDVINAYLEDNSKSSSQKNVKSYYDLDGHIVGDLKQNPSNITITIKGGMPIHEAILASIDITKQYKQPVQMIFNGVPVNVPYTNGAQNLSDIMAAYHKNVLQNYR